MPSASDVFVPGMLGGRAVLVTGGGTGLGRAAATEFAACGAQVVRRSSRGAGAPCCG